MAGFSLTLLLDDHKIKLRQTFPDKGCHSWWTSEHKPTNFIKVSSLQPESNSKKITYYGYLGLW